MQVFHIVTVDKLSFFPIYNWLLIIPTVIIIAVFIYTWH